MTFAHPYVLLWLFFLPVLAWLKGNWGQSASFLIPRWIWSVRFPA